MLVPVPGPVPKELIEHHLGAAGVQACYYMKNVFHQRAQRAATVRSTSVLALNVSTILPRIRDGSGAEPAARLSAIAPIPRASASGSFGGTTIPVSATIHAASPTFVTTQGFPHAMASPMALGNPSP